MRKLSIFVFILLIALLSAASPSYAITSGLQKTSESVTTLNSGTAEKMDAAKPKSAGTSGDAAKSAIKTTTKFQEKSWKRGPAPFGRRDNSKSQSGESETKK